MRYLFAAASVLAATTAVVAADPQRLTTVEMDRVTAGTNQTASYSVVEHSETVNGRTRTRTEIVERFREGENFKTRRVEAVDGKVVDGDPALYRRYLRENAKAREALRNALSGVGSEWFDRFDLDLNLEGISENF